MAHFTVDRMLAAYRELYADVRAGAVEVGVAA